MCIISYAKDHRHLFKLGEDNTKNISINHKAIIFSFIKNLKDQYDDAQKVSVEVFKRYREDFLVIIGIDDLKLSGSFPASVVVDNDYDSHLLESIFFGIDFQEM